MYLKEIGLCAPSMLNSQYDLNDHFMSTGMFTWIMNKIYMWGPKIMSTNHMFHILRQVGAERKVRK